MYSNYMYSNAPASSRRGGGSWVYVNGELYHVGIKGMQWGKHLPGTDWWRKTTNSNMGGWRPGGKYSLGERIVGNLKTAGQAARIYGQKLRESPGYYARQVRKNTRNEFERNRKESEAMGTRNLSHIQVAMQRQIEDGRKAVQKLVDNPNSRVNTINLAIQNAQYNILKGVNSFLTRFGLADKVDKFISKIIGNQSGRQKQLFTQNMGAARREDSANVTRLSNQSFLDQQAALRRQDNANVDRLLDQNYLNQLGSAKRQDYANVGRLTRPNLDYSGYNQYTKPKNKNKTR